MPAIVTGRVPRASALALDVHAGQTRKGTDVPYISHILGVASLVLEGRGDEDALIAALLHDTVEGGGDPVRLRNQIVGEFGSQVIEVVDALSDAAPAAGQAKGPWRARKAAYIAHIRVSQGPRVHLVCIADKLHNLTATVRDVDAAGPSAWDCFNAGPSDQRWYYESLGDVFVAGPLTGSDIARRYAGALDDLRERVPAENVTHTSGPPAARAGEVIAVGVDGCPAGWVAAIAGEGGPVEIAVFPNIEELVTAIRARGSAPIIAVDVPIGLPSTPGHRPCDKQARAMLKSPEKARSRELSVFQVPDRELIALTTFEQVQAMVAKRREGDPTARGISKQSFAIAPKIREVDAFVRAAPGCEEWLLEVHPEVCFREMSGLKGPLLPKATAVGKAERAALLPIALGEFGITVPAPMPKVSGAKPDDVLDAFVGLWTALRHRAAKSAVLGGDKDAHEVIMRMVV